MAFSNLPSILTLQVIIPSECLGISGYSSQSDAQVTEPTNYSVRLADLNTASMVHFSISFVFVDIPVFAGQGTTANSLHTRDQIVKDCLCSYNR